MSMITSEADVQRVLDEYDWAHRDENCPVERRRRERAEAEQQRRQKVVDMADARRKAVAQQRDQLAAMDQRVQEHLAPLKEAFVEFMASEVEPLRVENAALRQRCAELEARIDTVRDHASQHVDTRIEAEVGSLLTAAVSIRPSATRVATFHMPTGPASRALDTMRSHPMFAGRTTRTRHTCGST